MRPFDRDLDDEIRGHLALSIQERVERGEDPATARLAALEEFGYVPAIRESMRRVWFSATLETCQAFWQDVRIGFRSLLRGRGLAATVVITLALGIGANAAMFSLVRGVLLRPLVNRGEDRLLYIRQSAPGVGTANLTFSMAEIADIQARVSSIASFGDFSTVTFTMLGFGEPRTIQAGVVNGTFFEVMGLRPVLGRLLRPGDDGPDAAGVAVLTHRFWSTVLGADPSVLGRTIRLGQRSATIVGVLEPSIPYPADTEIIANVVTSPHHLGATMVSERTHRMTELFGRLAPGASLESARQELAAAHEAVMREHPEAYPATAGIQLTVSRLRDQIAAPARPILLVLLAAAGVIFVIACANVANLILARSVRREGEMVVRAALGASRGALRRTLLAESLVLCVAGAALGVVLARPLIALVAQFASRYSVRALEVTVDTTLLFVCAGLAIAAAVVLAWIPRLPSSCSGLTAGNTRVTTATNRRLRAFAVVQVALSFVLLASAGALVATLVALQHAPTTYETRRVLAIDVPPGATGIGGAEVVATLQDAAARIGELDGVTGVAAGSLVPWRDAGHGLNLQFAIEGQQRAPGEDDPYGRFRVVTPGYFRVLGIPIVAGRDFTDADRQRTEPVVIVSRSLAARFFPDGQALGGRLWWRAPVAGLSAPRRIVGIAADADDESIVPGAPLTVYHPLQQVAMAGRLFVQASGDPYALLPEVKRVIREVSAEQAIDRAATLADIRADVLEPERLNAFVLSGFAGVALLIAVVGVAGVLAFSVSARTREFGVLLAIGSTRRHLLIRVLADGALIAAAGVAAGGTAGYLLARFAARHLVYVQLPGPVAIAGAAVVITAAAILAALLPAARASRVDVMQALNTGD